MPYAAPALTPEEEALLAAEARSVQEPPQNYIPGSTYVAPTGVPVEPVSGGGEPVAEPIVSTAPVASENSAPATQVYSEPAPASSELVPAGTAPPPTQQVAYPTATGAGYQTPSPESQDGTYGQQIVPDPVYSAPAAAPAGDGYYTGGGASTYYGGPSKEAQPYNTGQTTSIYPAASYGGYEAAQPLPAQGGNNWAPGWGGGVASASERSGESQRQEARAALYPANNAGQRWAPPPTTPSQYASEDAFAQAAREKEASNRGRVDPASDIRTLPAPSVPEPAMLDAERARQRRADEERIAATVNTPVVGDGAALGAALGGIGNSLRQRGALGSAMELAREFPSAVGSALDTTADIFVQDDGGRRGLVPNALDAAADRFIADDEGNPGMLPTSLDRLADVLIQDDQGKRGLLTKALFGQDKTEGQAVEPRGLSKTGIPEPGTPPRNVASNTPTPVTRMGLPELEDLNFGGIVPWLKENWIDADKGKEWGITKDDGTANLPGWGGVGSLISNIPTPSLPSSKPGTNQPVSRTGRAGAIEPGTYPSTPDSMTTQDISGLMTNTPDVFKAVTEYGSVTLPDGTVKGVVKVKGADHPELGPLVVGVLQGNSVIPVGKDASGEQFLALLQGANDYVDPGTVPEPTADAALNEVFEATDTTTNTNSGTTTKDSGGTTVPPWTGDSGSGGGGGGGSWRGGGSSGGGGSWNNDWDDDWSGGYRKSGGTRGSSGRSSSWGDEALGGREFTADDFMDAAKGDRKKAAFMAKAANRKRRAKGGKRTSGSSSSGFWEGFPFGRTTPMREHVLTAIAESKAKGKR
jgi:hypothetical protein